MTNSKKSPPKFKRPDDSALSKNHGNSVKYRKRVTEELESKKEIEDFYQSTAPKPKVF
jgi:hypothetical protein